MIKKLFGKRGAESLPKELTTEDLIVLERWDEAVAQLQNRINSNPNDLHANLRLAEVLVQSGRPQAALDKFLFVAESYTDDGFYDKSIALLTKIGRLAPGESAIETALRKAQQMKMLEHRRALALEGLLAAQSDRDALARLSLLDAQKLWQGIASSDFVLRLSGDQLKRIFGAAVLTHYPPGGVIVERDSREEFLLILATGTLQALVDTGDGRPHLLREFAAGDIVGDRALLEHQAWPATYRAGEPATVFRLEAAGLARALEGNPDPRLLLDALRSRRHDHDVAASVRKLLGSPA